MAQAAPKPVQSEGRRPSVPDWLSALGIKDGEYFSTSKLREQRASKARCISEAGRVHACLGLHTMGYQQELAVKMEAGKRVPLTPSDVAAEVGIRRDNVMRAMAQLKAWGLADWDGSTKAHMKLYAWAVPRPVEAKIVLRSEYNNQQTQQNQPLPFSPLALRVLKRCRIKLSPENVLSPEYISDVEAAARAVDEAVIVLARAVNCTQIRDRINKEERNERNISISEGSSSSSALCSLVEQAEDEEPPPEEKIEKIEKIENPEPPEPIKEVREAYPEGHWDDAKATESYRQTIKSAAEHKKLLEGLARHKQSERWLDNAGYWIPLASNFISKRLYNYDPPPKLTTGKARNAPYTIFDMIREGGTS